MVGFPRDAPTIVAWPAVCDDTARAHGGLGGQEPSKVPSDGPCQLGRETSTEPFLPCSVPRTDQDFFLFFIFYFVLLPI